MPDLTSSETKTPAKTTAAKSNVTSTAKTTSTSKASPISDAKPTAAAAKKPLAKTSPTPESKSVASTASHKTTTSASSKPAVQPSLPVTKAEPGRTESGGRLARLTAYWAGEGDYYTGHSLSSTGIHLHGGHCAVDPNIIPYGSVVKIAGLGTYLAVDTGSAVVSRTAAKEAGHNLVERAALVIDLFFEKRSEGERFAANGPKYAKISWWTPRSVDSSSPPHSVIATLDQEMARGGTL